MRAGGIEYQLSEATPDFTVGRADPAGGQTHIGLSDDPRLHRRLAHIRALPDYWELHNIGGWLHMTVSDAAGPGFDRVGPGERRVVPWQSVCVEAHLGDAVASFEVHQDFEATQATAAHPHHETGAATRKVFDLNPKFGYFRCLVALCEPLLITPENPVLPSNGAIAQRLNAAGTEDPPLTAKAVERRLAYCSQLLRQTMSDPAFQEITPREAPSRQLLADCAIRTGVVTARHLELIDAAD